MRMVFWINKSKLDISNIRTVITYKNKNLDKWKKMSIFLNKNKEILDIKLWTIVIVLDATKKNKIQF